MRAGHGGKGTREARTGRERQRKLGPRYVRASNDTLAAWHQEGSARGGCDSDDNDVKMRKVLLESGI